MSIYHGIKAASSISKVTGLSINLIRQYIELISESRKDVHLKAMMDDMIRQWKRSGTRIKKKEDISNGYMRNLAPMIGGVK